MRAYWIQTPRWLQAFTPHLRWHYPGREKRLYLSFDDGPTPDITLQTLDILDAQGVKAAFFMLGKNAAAHPEIVRELLARGHQVCNHGYAHANAWKVPRAQFLEDVQQGRSTLETLTGAPVPHFRPPYGRITPALARTLHTQGHTVIMWDLLAGDFDPAVNAETVAKRLRSGIRPGSILVLHDSVKCAPAMLPALPAFLREAQAQGYRFDLLP